MYTIKCCKIIFNGVIPDDVDPELAANSHPSCYHDFTAFEITIEIPFVPFVGLELKFPNSHAGFRTEPIEQIFWDSDGEFFSCNWEDMSCLHFSYESLIRNAVDSGWVIIPH